jgi:sulfur carrier protein
VLADLLTEKKPENLMLLMKPEGELQITVNDLPREIPAEFTLENLIQDMGFPTKGTAVAVDHSVVPRGKWADFYLEDQQKILVIQASQGG